ncbi:hypothetical protein BDV12DRAFT_201541 [Aspergillus spectabilis]
MSSNKPNDENDEPHSSGYEGDISDDVSESSTDDTETLSSRDSATESSNEDDDTEYGTIWIGCDVRDAGPGVENDDDAPFGTIWIGCNVREMDLDAPQALSDSDEEPSLEHVEDINELAEEEDSSDGKGGSSSK